MNGGGGGGGLWGFFVLLFLLAYVVTYSVIGAKEGGIWGGIVLPVLSVGLPLLIDARSDWFPLGALFFMFSAWIITLLVWREVAPLTKPKAKPEESETSRSNAIASDNRKQ